MIQEVGRALARVREMLLREASAGSAVRTELAQSAGALLGPDADMLGQLDAASAAQLIGSRVRIELWAQILDLEAESWRGEGAADRAARVAARAGALRTAAAALDE